MITVTFLFVIAAFITAIVSIMGKCPLWVPVILTIIVLLLMVLPK